MIIATEDEISEAICEELLKCVAPDLAIVGRVRKHGIGHLKKRLPNLLQAARTIPVFLLIDLDQSPCPAQLLQRWLGSASRPPRLFFRVAIREIESWLLADTAALATHVGIKNFNLPSPSDQINDPKRFLLSLERRMSRDMRALLCRNTDAAASQGIGYNTSGSIW